VKLLAAKVAVFVIAVFVVAETDCVDGKIIGVAVAVTVTLNEYAIRLLSWQVAIMMKSVVAKVPDVVPERVAAVVVVVNANPAIGPAVAVKPLPVA
jgi:hypothetical protein